jgi:hypothetical protein
MAGGRAAGMETGWDEDGVLERSTNMSAVSLRADLGRICHEQWSDHHDAVA